MGERGEQIQVATSGKSSVSKPRHRFGGWFVTRRWFGRPPKDEDARPYFEITHLIQARDMAQASFLFEGMTDALGCNNACGEDRPCPHFRFGGLHQLDNE